MFTQSKIYEVGSPHDLMTNMLHCDLEVNKFEIHLHYYIHFGTNSFGKGMNSLFLPVIV